MVQPYGLGTFSESGDRSFPGVARAGKVMPLRDLLLDAPTDLAELFVAWQDWDERIFRSLKDAREALWRPETELEVLLPYRPDQLLGAGANYRKHVIDLIVDKGAGGVEHMSKAERRPFAEKMMDERASTGKPFIWVAMRNAIAGSHDLLRLPRDILEPDWELELAVVIGKPARRVPREQALASVAGYTIANDVTARELVDRPDVKAMGMDWLAAKNAPGFNIIGPYITPARFVTDPQKLHIRLSLNGEVKQDEGTSDMIFDVARLIEYASLHVQLNPGDIIMTGSPSGNGTHSNRFLRDGDIMVGEIDGLIGAQRTPCRAE